MSAEGWIRDRRVARPERSKAALCLVSKPFGSDTQSSEPMAPDGVRGFTLADRCIHAIGELQKLR